MEEMNERRKRQKITAKTKRTKREDNDKMRKYECYTKDKRMEKNIEGIQTEENEKWGNKGTVTRGYQKRI